MEGWMEEWEMRLVKDVQKSFKSFTGQMPFS